MAPPQVFVAESLRERAAAARRKADIRAQADRMAAEGEAALKQAEQGNLVRACVVYRGWA